MRGTASGHSAIRVSIFDILLIFALTCSTTLADVQFTSPSGGSTATGGSLLKVQWKDSGTSPSLSDLQTYQLFLCAGGNDASSFIQLAPLVEKGEFSDGNSASGTVATGVGGSETNAYFLKMISTTTGGTVINYSDRFSLSGMTGTFPPNVETGIKGISGTSGPATENQVADSNAAGGAGGNGQPYSMQTGLTKYAPMQQRPGSKITAGSPKPLYPTSSVVTATAALPPPKQLTTLTASGTWSVTIEENTASPQANPNANAMQKFLNRWRD